MSYVTTIIKELQLKPHPEGGYYRETYRSTEIIAAQHLPEVFSGDRNVATCIYFLLPSNEFSAFHKIHQDEIWHFYEGATIRLVMLSEEGELTEVRIGKDIMHGEVPQFVVPKNHWFAAKIMAKDSFALVGCTVAPGFDFRDFALPSREVLLNTFPQHSEIITEFTRS